MKNENKNDSATMPNQDTEIKVKIDRRGTLWQDPDYRAKQSAARSIGAKRRWADPEKRQALIEARHGAASGPGQRSKKLREEAIAYLDANDLDLALMEQNAIGKRCERVARHVSFQNPDAFNHLLLKYKLIAMRGKKLKQRVVGYYLTSGLYPEIWTSKWRKLKD